LNRDRSQAPDLHIGFLLAPEFSVLPLAGMLDTLRHAADEADRSRQVYCAWTILSHDQKPVRSSSGVGMVPDRVLSLDDTPFDYVLIHGGRMEGLAKTPVSYLVYLKHAATKGVPLIGLDSGSFLLAQAGLLDGYRASIHWRHHAEFARRYPNTMASTGRIYTMDRDRITCPGGTAAIDLAVALITRHCGRGRALKGMADLLVDEPRGAHHEVKSYREGHDTDADPRVQRAVARMREQLGQPFPIARLARECGTSERQLTRLFKARYRESPSRYWRRMRLDHAAWRLLNTTHSLQRIADECGFSDASHLSTTFTKTFGRTPRKYRSGGATGRQGGEALKARRSPGGPNGNTMEQP
jgi:transcriptional regulator GlxA family with amidase domain